MSYDETLAERVRWVLADVDSEITERRMFGGLAFMLDGRMVTGIVGDELMIRVGAAAATEALAARHVRAMDFTGRPMKSMVFVAQEGLKGPALRRWINQAVTFVRSLPPKTTNRTVR